MSQHKQKKGSVLLLFFIIAFLITTFSCVQGAFINKESAIRTLNAHGFSEIEIVDHAWFVVGMRGCDTKDTARFTANALNPRGEKIKVYVCFGLLKSGTLRIP